MANAQLGDARKQTKSLKSQEKITSRSNGKFLITMVILMILLVVFFFLDLLLGSVKVPVNEVISILSGNGSIKEEWRTIILDFRFPKALTAIIAGSALSVSGLQMQTIFKNPLAGPYVLGISSGAGLGVALLVLGGSTLFGFSSISYLGNWGVIVAAWLGAGIILLLILAVSFRLRDIMTILVLGIMFGYATSSLINILQYFSDEAHLKSFVIWTFGSLSSVNKPQLYVLAPGVILGLIIAFASAKVLNALLLGENYAKSMGMNIKMSRIFVFISTSLLAGSVTAFCGPIGFIGIAAPHVTRMLMKTADHKFLIPGSALLGSVVLLIGDIISQLPGYSNVLPINSITAMLGVPVVIIIIVRNFKVSS